MSLKNLGKSAGHMFDRCGPHNFTRYELSSGPVIVCTYCGWKRDDCKNKKNCSGNAIGPYAKLIRDKLGNKESYI